jgi:hypothetical protein
VSIQTPAKMLSFLGPPLAVDPENPVINMSLDSRIRGNDKVLLHH